jgi:flagellar motor switch protein FliN
MNDSSELMEDSDIDWAAALAEQEQAARRGRAGQTRPTGGADYFRHEFESLEGLSAETTEDVNLDLILDIPVTISVEIGRTKINVRNLLQLNQGSVVELDRLAGEPMDVLVNGTLIAQGEVVVVDEKFGIRLTDVVSPQERAKRLR